MSYAEQSDEVSFLVFETRPEHAWRSVIIEGTLDRITIDDWETAREAIGDNAYRADLLTNVNRWEDPRVWAIEIESWSGRKRDSS